MHLTFPRDQDFDLEKHKTKIFSSSEETMKLLSSSWPKDDDDYSARIALD